MDSINSEQKRRQTILIADDSEMNRSILADMLEGTYEIIEAEDGLKAVAALQQHETDIDLVLLDIVMPDMDGFALMRQIAREYAGIPVICVTARDEVPDRVKGLKGGAEDDIVKPFAMEELLARVQVVLRRFNKEQNLFRIRDVEVDLAGGFVKKEGASVELTNREYELLKVLLLNKNIALSSALS